MKVISLLNQQFARLTVIKEVPKSERAGNHTQWLCKCSCGKIIITSGYVLKNGNTKSCGCLRSEKAAQKIKKLISKVKYTPKEAVARIAFCHFDNKNEVKITFEEYYKITQKNCYHCECEAANFYKSSYYDNIYRYTGLYRINYESSLTIDNLIQCCKSCGNKLYYIIPCKKFNPNSLVGLKFNKLTIIAEAGMRRKQRLWKCQCDCGKITYIVTNKLCSGQTKSCGCIRKEAAAARFKQYNKERELCLKNSHGMTSTYVYRESYNDGNISYEEFVQMSQKNCFYCNKAPSNKRAFARPDENGNTHFIYNGLDILNHSTDPAIYVHNHDNTVTCCRECNMSKRNVNYNEFCQLISAIHSRTVEGRSEIIVPSDSEIRTMMRQEGFFQLPRNGKEFRTAKGLGLNNRYWNYTDNDELTLEKFYHLSQHSCWYCGTGTSNFITYFDNMGVQQKLYYNGLDRRDQTQPHILSNIYPCCWTCNRAKTKRSADEFLAWATRAYEHLLANNRLPPDINTT